MFIALGGSYLADAASQYPDRSRSGAKSRFTRDDGPTSDGLKRQDFGLLAIEKRIVALIVEGYSTAEAANQIGASDTALAQRLIGICVKLHVLNEFELLLFALYHRLIDSFDDSPPCA
jgi:DNA-binding NarL/FixJ family response regulator